MKQIVFEEGVIAKSSLLEIMAEIRTFMTEKISHLEKKFR
jgi:hypothetical protein